MKIKRINQGPLTVFLILFSLIGIASFNSTKDWATAFFQGLTGGFVCAFIYIVGYLGGVKEGKGKGYLKAMKDLNPVLPPEIQKK